MVARFWLLICWVLAVPAMLVSVAAASNLNRLHLGPRVWITVVVPAAAGIISLLVGIYTALMMHRKGGSYSPFKKISGFFLVQGRSAILIGTGTASLLLALYFCFTASSPGVQEDVAERFATGLTIYTGVITLFIAAQIFYDSVAPITNLAHLLRSLTHDLQTDLVKDGRLWFVYPQLNLGQYTLGRNDGNSLYKAFRNAFQDAVERWGDKACLVVISMEESPAFWTAYLQGTGFLKADENPAGFPETDPRRKVWMSLYKGASNLFNYEGDDQTSSPCRWEVPDHSFPPHVIVIGDVVYQITSFGLPIRSKEGQWKPSTEHGSAELLAYRRQDRGLAERIGNRMNELVHGYTRVAQGEEQKMSA